jgi:hypothetical protein
MIGLWRLTVGPSSAAVSWPEHESPSPHAAGGRSGCGGAIGPDGSPTAKAATGGRIVAFLVILTVTLMAFGAHFA